jgi:hypothetical protein
MAGSEAPPASVRPSCRRGAYARFSRNVEPSRGPMGCSRTSHRVRHCRSHRNAIGIFIERYYDPATGQFLSVDPLVSSTGEPYAYARDDPVNGSDPNGLHLACGENNQDCAGLTEAQYAGSTLGESAATVAVLNAEPALGNATPIASGQQYAAVNGPSGSSVVPQVPSFLPAPVSPPSRPFVVTSSPGQNLQCTLGWAQCMTPQGLAELRSQYARAFPPVPVDSGSQPSLAQVSEGAQILGYTNACAIGAAAGAESGARAGPTGAVTLLVIGCGLGLLSDWLGQPWLNPEGWFR